MKTHILSTKDGLEFRTDERTAQEWSHQLDNGLPVYINGNRVTSADSPRIRAIVAPNRGLPELVEGVFNGRSPHWKLLYAFATKFGAELRKEGKNIYPPLIDWVVSEVGSDDPGLVMQFMKDQWDLIQDYNNPTEKKRLDHNAREKFTPSNWRGIFCGKCSEGWLPGYEGMIPCSCNKGVKNLMG